MAGSTRSVLAAALLGAVPPALAGSVACHIDYGGETSTLVAPPVAYPYTVKAVPFGSHFLFRIVVRAQPADLASVKIYAYVDRDDGPAPIHQATHPWPPQVAGPWGFTGLHHVYEPIRDSELRYWCELKNSP